MEAIEQFNESMKELIGVARNLNAKLDSTKDTLQEAHGRIRDVVRDSHLSATLTMLREDMDLRMLLNRTRF